MTGVAGLGLLQNAATGFCGGNWLFGIDTTDG
nr:YgaP-like transmembrane domain [Halorarius halobius]